MAVFDHFRPTLTASRIELLTPDQLTQVGLSRIKAIFLDVDGTLMRHHAKELEPTVGNTLITLGEAGLKLCIISNAYGQRVTELEEIFTPYTMSVYTPAQVTPPGDSPKRYRKPKGDMLEFAANDLGYQPDEVLMGGDQWLKDGWSAQRTGAHWLLVERRGEDDDPNVKRFQRPLEKLVFDALNIEFRDELIRLK